MREGVVLDRLIHLSLAELARSVYVSNARELVPSDRYLTGGTTFRGDLLGCSCVVSMHC
jgi:hypothetical protein